jgi:hypothetical protein
LFSLSKGVFGKYKLLVVKMDEGNVILKIVKVNYSLLCDVENTPRFGLCVYLCWKQCKDHPNLPKGTIFSFVTLFFPWSLRKLACLLSIMTLKRGTLHNTFLCSLTLLSTLMIICAWLGGKSLLLEVHYFFYGM